MKIIDHPSPETLRMRKWRRRNREKARAAVRKYRANHREESRKAYRDWAKKNPEIVKLCWDRWRKNNPSKIKRYRKRWYAKHGAAYNARRREKNRLTAPERRKADKIKRRAMKRKLIVLFGGKCSCCGFEKNLPALDFHHVRGTKRCTVSKLLNALRWDDAVKEAKKCEILCSNCHRVHHWRD